MAWNWPIAFSKSMERCRFFSCLPWPTPIAEMVHSKAVPGLGVARQGYRGFRSRAFAQLPVLNSRERHLHGYGVSEEIKRAGVQCSGIPVQGGHAQNADRASREASDLRTGGPGRLHLLYS